MTSLPNKKGRFGPYGGRYVPETLMSALVELEAAYLSSKENPKFKRELANALKNYVGRPTPLYFAKRLTEALRGPKIYLKREDLCHTGAHKINNTMGQVLLTRQMGKKRVIAETGAGQHGVAVATVAAKFNLECKIYMGEVDKTRQKPNVTRMEHLGAEVVGVSEGSKTLKDAINAAMRDWTTNVANTHYILGSVLGPHPYPMMIRDFQSVIGLEAHQQILKAEGRLPDCLIACVGGGSNAIGLFHPFLSNKSIRMIGVEAGGMGIASGKHAARMATGSIGVLHGTMTTLLQDPHGQIQETHSVSAGLDYAAIGPEHSYYRDKKRIEYSHATDEAALRAFRLLARTEGILPALESSHAIAYLMEIASSFDSRQIVILNLSGRGDKDIDQITSEEVLD